MIQNKSLIKILTSLLTAFTLFMNWISQLFTGGGGMDLSQVTAADYEHIKTTYTQMMLGTDNLNMADNDIKAKIDGIAGAGLYWQGRLVKDGTVPWAGGAEITASPQISTVYANVYAMARAYACRQGSAYRDAALLADILYCLNWMYDHVYGADVSVFSEYGNWWDWEIGGPTRLVNTLVLIRGSVSQDQIDKYLIPVNYFVSAPERTSANLVDAAYIVIGAGALQKDGAKLYKAREKLKTVFTYVAAGDGFYTDGSYVMHENIAYQGGYGTIMLEALSRIVLALDDTYFAVSGENIRTQVAWVFDSYVPLMYKGSLPGMVRGRNICRNTDDVGIGYPAVAGMLRMAQYADEESAGKLAAAVKYYCRENMQRYTAGSDIFDLCLFKELMNDDTVQAMDCPDITKVFPKMDRVSKITDSYSVGISMASKRIAKYEAINGENGKGWYTGDGMLYISNSVNDYNYDYWSHVNYYRLPGTTITTRERTDKNLTIKTLPNTVFAGGVSLGGCAAAAMQLLGSNADFSSTLKAKKAWFLFDDEIVALGADIRCSDAYSTETVIENRRITAGSEFTADGNPASGSEGVLANPRSIFISGLGGIYLPEASTVNYKKTNTAPAFLELWIDHGKNISGGTYSYVMLPGKTETQTQNYAGHPDVEILANNASVQAVRENNLMCTGYVFHSPGTFGNITVTKPCIVMIKQTGSDIKLTVCDPTQELTGLKVAVNNPGLAVSEADNSIKCNTINDGIELSVDFSSRSGLGATASFVLN